MHVTASDTQMMPASDPVEQRIYGMVTVAHIKRCPNECRLLEVLKVICIQQSVTKCLEQLAKFIRAVLVDYKCSCKPQLQA